MSGAQRAYAAFRDISDVPSTTLAWNVYGKGVENVGHGGLPEEVPVGAPGPDQLLVRVDAVGLCFSDVKLIRQGGEHPKLYGRDLAKEPTRLGHEAAVTIVAVGKRLAPRFRPGERLAIQPDIYVRGRSTAYGYTIPGALIGYHLIGPEVLAADDGAYVIPVPDDLGYAEAALTEPWATVEAAYSQRRRVRPAPGGRALVIARAGDDRSYRLGEVLAQAREVVRAVDDVPTGPFDDIVMLGPRSANLVSRAADALDFRGMLNVVAADPLDGRVEIDIGRLHYHYTAYVGATGLDVGAAYGETRNRTELRSNGVALIVGAAGPMGQMHIERALRLPNGPRTTIGVDPNADRLALAEERLRPTAAASGRRLVMTTGADLATLVSAESAGRGADDVIVTAPTADAVRAADAVMAADGMLVMFAGLPVGTRASVDLSRVFLHGAQYTGTSGSRISDQERVVRKTVNHELAPGRAVAAVGGMEAAPEGLRALMENRYPGKIVIFPQLRGLPLTSLADLAAGDTELAAALGSGGTWTAAAEAVLFARYLARGLASRS
jgi:threonine dehydrogenase-like Zn-dependent dehydrogenase